MVAMTDTADGNKDLRMGGQNGALQWNRASDDATLPEQSPAGVALSVPLPTTPGPAWSSWSTATTASCRPGSTAPPSPGCPRTGWPPTTSTASGTTAPGGPRLTDLKLGWESYGEGADTLWYDDVAVGASRIGC